MLDLTRLLQPAQTSFFLFGPRGVGKSYWVHRHFATAHTFDLLDTRVYLELSRNPNLLETHIGPAATQTWICIDEVQKIPALLDEVHRLIERKRYRFVLTGSSARKLKRSGTNLLAGRAITKQMEGFVAGELGDRFDLSRAIEWGTLPLIWTQPTQSAQTLEAYVNTYIKEEIKEEGAVRKVEPFLRFLEIAGIVNGEVLVRENISREAKVPRSTVDTYFSILEDTLIGHFLPAYRPQAKVREATHAKFYWFDPGVARGAAGLLFDPVDAIWLGKALETYLFHELRVYNHTQQRHRLIAYYRTGAGQEIDFVIEVRKRTATTKARVVCIEVKHATRWRREWETAMRSLAASNTLTIDRMIGVYGGTESAHYDGLDILPIPTFLQQLYAGEIF